MSEKGLPPLLDRHWAESALAIGAVIIAAVSLWMAYDTERTNRELVASQSWPYIQLYESDASDPGERVMSLVITNNGIGPAKLESFELFWKGEPQRNPFHLLQACCAQAQSGAGQPVDLATLRRDVAISTSADEGIVVRAGQTIPFLQVLRNAKDAGVWDALHDGFLARNISVRYCYCSAFDECWLASQQFGEVHQMNPPRVRSCPLPKVPYDNLLD